MLIVLLVGGGIFFMRRNKTDQASITPTPNFQTPTDMPTETPVEEVDVATFNVKVLNGTTVAGLAAKVQGQLETAGFTVSSIGNADRKDYQQVVIQAKTSVPTSAIDKLKEAIGTTYTFAEQEELDDTEEDNIVVILGMKVTASPTSAVKPTSGVTGTPATTQGAVTPTTTLTPTPTP